MPKRSLVTILLAALAVFSAPTLAQEPVSPALIKQVQACRPAYPCAHKLPVRIVIVTMFEVGKDEGDAPGEFQYWKTRRHLDVRIAFPQSYHDLYYNPKSRILGVVTGQGNIRSADAIMALGLDTRFDLTHAYWLVAGIAGINPDKASIGSAAWARYLVDGDLAHEIDAREIPKGWKTGYFPLGTASPNHLGPPHPHGEMFELNPKLQGWAYDLTRTMKLPDDPRIKASRARYVGYPMAQRPPFVLKGDNLAAMTYWHGKLLNTWATNWVKYWTGGKGTFVTSAMEETGTYSSIRYLDRVGRVDKNRVMVLRAGSNYTMPPPGVTAAQDMADQSKGYAGMKEALESLYLVGSKVIDRIEANWSTYRNTIPSSGKGGK